MKRVILTLCLCMLIITAGLNAAAAGEMKIGEPGEGGFREYLFMDKFSEKEAPEMAELLALAIEKGRSIVFQQLPKINNPELGDKEFTADYFEGKLVPQLKQRIDALTPAQKASFDKFLWSAKLTIALNQDRINMKGAGFKHFLPAMWARETAAIFQIKTGIIIKQPANLYRNPCNKPDDAEKKVLTRFTMQDYDKKEYGEMSMIGKQKVYRHFRPVFMSTGCLGCHGDKQGELDVLGFKKDGLKSGDVRAAISVTVPIK